jgi:hypothetical protein
MILVDRGLAVLGWLAATIERRAGGSRRAAWAAVAALVLLSAIPTVMIGSSPRPTDLTFDDVRYKRIPAMTSWVRMEGDLRASPGGGHLYELVDPADPRSYVNVDSAAPLALGPAMVTGQLGLGSGSIGASGFLGLIVADVPAVPRQNEPFQLILLPAALGIAVALGIQIGYPVVRPDPRPPTRSAPLAPDARLPARWSGWIRNDSVKRDGMLACTLGVVRDGDVHRLTIADARAERVLPVRRRSTNRVRLCRLDGFRAGLDVRAAGADVIIEFDDPADRDRLASALA